ncbi:non-canonical purine NTP pyrophosphatase [Mycoplasma sp. ATU-Cv-703]|uniref:non-canonical purine NTP pyrophosphatase n=1 Tax=Mycoplasma sp. ATU-Cv-703 TaxID=2498595 RepID=UPI000FDF3D74
MLKILLATTNAHKVEEFTALWKSYDPDQLAGQLLILKSLPEAPEEGASFAANAAFKARFYYELYRQPVLADDSGLEVQALGNFPGLYSRRWLKDAPFRVKSLALLAQLGSQDNSCRYRSAIAYCDQNGLRVFEGEVSGKLVVPVGPDGFGFDPAFYLQSEQKVFAELDLASKNKISHRGRAFARFWNFWQQLIEQVAKDAP